MNNKDFETGFEREDDLTRALDFLTKTIQKAQEREQDVPAVTVPAKYAQMEFAYKAMKFLTQGTSEKVSYELNEPFRGVGSVIVKGKELSFSSSKWFTRVAEFANNMEVYPMTNGKVCMALTFYGLTKDMK